MIEEGGLLYFMKENEKVIKRKVIIADDEQHICRLIEALIDWEQYGLKIVGFANDGNKAFQMCEELAPDLLITDIRMPGLSGIDLIKKLYEAFPDIKVIIITGYSQFLYAQQALKYGVVDYLLKPIQKEELENALEKGLDLIDTEIVRNFNNKNLALKSMQEIKDNLLTLILNGRNRSTKFGSGDRFLEEYHLKFHGNAWQLLQIECILNSEENMISLQEFLGQKIKDIVIEELRNDKVEMLTTLMDNSFFCLFNSDRATLEQVKYALNQVRNKLLIVNDILQKINFTIGFSSIYEDVRDIYHCVDECESCINHKIIKGKNKIIKYGDVQKAEYKATYFIDENFRKRFMKIIVDADSEEMSAEMNELVTLLYRYSAKINGNVILEIYQMLIKVFYKGIQVFNISDFREFSQENLISQKQYFYSIAGAFTYLSDIFQLLLKRCVEEKEDQNTRPIRNAQLYIEEHYMESIALEEIAKHVGLNETYLSSIFKKQMGKSLIDFLTYVRIQHAKELLIDHQKSINEIAEAVGFNDAKYFTKRFKKFTGVSPNEYRKLFA